MGLQRSGADRGDQVQPGGEPPKLKFTRGADGKVQIVGDPAKTVETSESAERPPTPDDPRASNMRDVPPFGGA